MTISLFPTAHRVQKNDDLARSKRDVKLAEMLHSLCVVSTSLGSVFEIEELSALSYSVLELRKQLLLTSEHSIEGIIVRQSCQRLLESAACGLLETMRSNDCPQPELPPA